MQQPYPQQVTTYQTTQYTGNSRVVNGANTARDRAEQYNAKSSIALGVIQIVIALLCIVFDVVAVVMQHERRERDSGYDSYDTFNSSLHTFAGIWCGIFFLISGSLALAAGKQKQMGLIIAGMVMSIISTIFSFIMMITYATATGKETSKDYTANRYVFQITLFSSYSTSTQTVKGTIDNVSLAMAVLLLILALMEIVVAIWTSTLYCVLGCCTTTPAYRSNAVVVPSNGGTVSYVNTGPGGGQNQTVIMHSTTMAQAPPYQQYPGGYYPQPVAQQGGYLNQMSVFPARAQQHQIGGQLGHPQQGWPTRPAGPSTYTTQHGDANVHMPAPPHMPTPPHMPAPPPYGGAAEGKQPRY